MYYHLKEEPKPTPDYMMRLSGDMISTAREMMVLAESLMLKANQLIQNSGQEDPAPAPLITKPLHDKNKQSSK